MTVILLVVASVLALAGAAFFAGSETAFLSVSRERVLHLSREGGRKAKILQGILNDMSKTTTTLLIGNNLSSVIYSTATAALIADCVSGTTLQSVCSFLAAFTVLYVSEFLPKLLCAARPLRRSLSAAEPYLWCERALSPLVSIAMKLTNCFIRKRGDNRYQVTSADLVRILQDRKDGVRLSEFESALISRLIVLRIKKRRITVAEIFSALNGRQAMLAAFAALSVTVASAAGGVDIAPLPDKTGVMAGDGVFKNAKWIGVEGETVYSKVGDIS